MLWPHISLRSEPSLILHLEVKFNGDPGSEHFSQIKMLHHFQVIVLFILFSQFAVLLLHASVSTAHVNAIFAKGFCFILLALLSPAGPSGCFEKRELKLKHLPTERFPPCTS